MSRKPTLRAALLSAAAGAALFLGVGAALPLWDVFPGPNTGSVLYLEGPHWIGLTERGPLWRALARKVWVENHMRSLGAVGGYLVPQVALAPAGLLVIGAAAGLLGYVASRR